jgi:hypothetical protein
VVVSVLSVVDIGSHDSAAGSLDLAPAFVAGEHPEP